MGTRIDQQSQVAAAAWPPSSTRSAMTEKDEPTAASDKPPDRLAGGSRPQKGIPAVSSQTDFRQDEKPASRFPRKGTGFGYWGYNRAFYTRSDIHLTGTGYDVTLNNAAATDKFGFRSYGDFFRRIWTTQPTVPQYNYRFGYYFDDKNSFSMGQDHMKYKLAAQTAVMSGTVEPEASAQYAGNYDHTPLPVGHDGDAVSEFEHCDGLNFIDAQVGQTQNLWVSRNGQHALSVTGSVGAGIVVTDTRATIFNNDRDHHRFRLDGCGVSTGLGLRADLFRRAFIEAQLKAGYINLQNVRTAGDGKANQQFGFLEPMIVAGLTIPLKRNKS